MTIAVSFLNLENQNRHQVGFVQLQLWVIILREGTGFYSLDRVMTTLGSILPDDGGGRVCQGCTASECDYILTLFTYSCYTDRHSFFRGDTLFLAAQTLDHKTVTIEFPRVPYRLYLTPSDFRDIQKKGGVPDAEIRSCIRTLDSSCSDGQEFIEVRVYSRMRYLNVYKRLVENNLTLAIDGAHDALNGLDAVLNLGIPGACAVLRFRRSAAKVVGESHWLVEEPADICVHGVSPRMPLFRNVVAMEWNDDRTLSIGFADGTERRVATFEMRDILSKIRPTVILVRNKDITLQQIGEGAPGLFYALFSSLPRCLPEYPRAHRPFRPGLGVFVFDVVSITGLSPNVPLCRWVDAYFSQRWLEERWNVAVTLHTTIHDSLGAYEAFTAAMVLRYASTRTVCEMTEAARAPYEGGHTIAPRPAYLLEQPVAEFDFVSMYPTIAQTINAGKDTYTPSGGDWNLGAVGGFTIARRGCLADALRAQLEERMRIVNDPAMQGRARSLKQTINAMVGMAGNRKNPYSDTRVAGCITATGRRLLQACHRVVAADTLAGYTDSLFLKLPCLSSSEDPLYSWMSRSVVAEHQARFKTVIHKELESMAPTVEHGTESSLRFDCKQIAMAALFTGAAHSYAVGHLIFQDGATENPLVDIQVKGSLKSAAMECIRLFYEALVDICIAGYFFLADENSSHVHEIRKLAALVPIRVMTNTGWKQAVKVTTSSEPHGMTNAIVRYADDTESHHWFLPEAHVDKLVEVTHVICPDEVWSCVDRRRLTIVATLETFYRQLCQGRLPLSAYATDKSGQVLVKLDDGQSKCVRLWEAARNGLHLDLENYSKRWMEKCVENINCDICHLPLIDAAQSRYVSGQDEKGPALLHESCSPAHALSLDEVASTHLSSHIKTALSAILVAGSNNALQAVDRLIALRKMVESVSVKEMLPSEPYQQILEQIKANVADGKSSKNYLDDRQAFCCIPDGQHSWFCLPTLPNSKTVLDLLYRAMRVVVRRGKYAGDDAVMKAIDSYPAHRLRVAPPPILLADGTAPSPAWQEVMNKSAESAECPKFITSTPFHCQVCYGAFNLDIGACGHLACKTCSYGWKICVICRVEWHGWNFSRNTQMNYHSSVFPLKEWYEELPTTKWRVYCGPEELIYDSSTRHIIALARGEALS